jgi:uncharacterized membrane protein YbhN (UPF0104 family)
VSAFWSAVAAITGVLSHANVGVVVAAVAVDTGSMVLQSFRWRLFLSSLRSGATLWDALLAYAAGVCVCNITPARVIGGDAARAALIPRPAGSPPLSAMAASVVYDRSADVAGALLLIPIALPALRLQSSYWLPAGLVLAVAGVFAARPLFRRLTARIAERHPALIGRDMRGAVISALGCSVVISLLDITRITLVAAAFGVRFTPAQAASISLLRLGSGIVPVPAGIGVVDGALIAGFMWFGLPRDTAAALAIVERSIVYGWDTLLGAAALLMLGGTKALTKARSQPATVDIPAEA